jgi:hypothetical protein
LDYFIATNLTNQKGATMNTKKLFLLLSAVLFLSTAVMAQDAGQDEQMKVWMDYMTPGQVHQAMASFAGEPMVSEGSCKMEMLLGGRYLKSTHIGTYMGMPFEGFSIEGFDKATNMFNYVWVDNFGTGMMTMKGTYDDATKSVTYKGTMVDPVQKKEVPVKEVVTVGDPNKVVMEMFSEVEGKEFKSMEMIFTRK